MSTPEANQPSEEHSIENGDGEDNQPQRDGKISPEAVTNSSIVSASDIRESVNDTMVEAPSEESPSAENGSKDEEKAAEPVVEALSEESPTRSAENGSNGEDKAAEPVEEPASNGESANGGDDWQDVLGNGQLMKKVRKSHVVVFQL